MSEINNKITFSTHTAYNNCMRNSIIWDYIIAETMSFCLMPCFMVYKCLNILGREIILGRNWIFLSYVNPLLSYFFLFWICKVFFGDSEVFSETYDVDSLPMLWHTKKHRIDDLRVWHNISNFIKCVKNGFECLTFIVNNQSLNIL